MTSRALKPDAAYWVAMYAASALGTNLGDFAAFGGGLGFGLGASFGALAAISLALIALDRTAGRGGELLFWLALVVLRAMATNVGDFLPGALNLSRGSIALALGVLTLGAGYFTAGVGAPRVDARYWIAMALGGAFGTVAGDMTAHAFGLALAAGLLALALVAGVAARPARAGVMSYWALVLVERAAGTPAGDVLASSRGLGLGLPLATAITGAAFAAAVVWRLAPKPRATAPAR